MSATETLHQAAAPVVASASPAAPAAPVRPARSPSPSPPPSPSQSRSPSPPSLRVKALKRRPEAVAVSSSLKRIELLSPADRWQLDGDREARWTQSLSSQTTDKRRQQDDCTVEMRTDETEVEVSSRPSPSAFLSSASRLRAASPPAAPLPSSAVSALSGISCLVRVDSERYLEHLLPLFSRHRHSAALPFRLPHGGVWWESVAASGLLRLHLRFDLPAAPRRFDWWQIDISGLRVQQTWREDEDRRQRERTDWELDTQDRDELSPAAISSSSAEQERNEQETAGGLTVSFRHNDEDAVISVARHGVPVRCADWSLTALLLSPAASSSLDSASRGCNWEALSLRYRRLLWPQLDYELHLTPVMARGVEWNAAAARHSVGELHWSEQGRLRQPEAETEEDWEDDVDEAESAFDSNTSTAEKRLNLTALLSDGGEDDAVSDDDPQLAIALSSSSTLSFPFLADADYAVSQQLESVLLSWQRSTAALTGSSQWRRCSLCRRSRRLPLWLDSSRLPAVWQCRLNPEMLMDDCGKEEEDRRGARRLYCSDWAEDVCAVCEKGEELAARAGLFGGWARLQGRAVALEPSAAVLSNQYAAAASSSSASLRQAAFASSSSPRTGFPLVSIPPAPPGQPMRSCDGPCCRSFHLACLANAAQLSGSKAALSDEAAAGWYCSDCEANRHSCFVCGQRGQEGAELRRCNAVCGKHYHPSCMPALWTYHRSVRTKFRDWRRREFDSRRARRRQAAREAEGEREDGKEEEGGEEQREDEDEDSSLDSFVCPLHWCARCGESGEDRILMRCLRCPVAFHCSAPCRPVHVRLLTERTFVCQQHDDDDGDRAAAAASAAGGGGGGGAATGGRPRKPAVITLRHSKPQRRIRLSLWMKKAAACERALGIRSPPGQRAASALALFPALLSYSPPSLPLKASTTLTVFSLGRVVPDRPAFHLENAVFPVGYKAVKRLSSRRRSGLSLHLLCEIRDGGTGPIFHIRPLCVSWTRGAGMEEAGKQEVEHKKDAEDGQDGGEVVCAVAADDGLSDRFIDALWQKAGKRFHHWASRADRAGGGGGGRLKAEANEFVAHMEQPRPPAAIASLPGLTGCAKFGLLLDTVRDCIEAMPHTADCERYRARQRSSAAAAPKQRLGDTETVDLTQPDAAQLSVAPDSAPLPVPAVSSLLSDPAPSQPPQSQPPASAPPPPAQPHAVTAPAETGAGDENEFKKATSQAATQC